MTSTPRSVVDAHHHLWGPDFAGGAAGVYLLDDLRADAASVPGLDETIFMECGVRYDTDGPAHLRSVGETAWVASVAEESDRTDGARIVGIVGHTDLTLSIDLLDEALDAHERAGRGRFRGIRDALACPPPDTPVMIPGRAEANRGADPAFRRGVAHLGERGLTYDTWQYHTQAPELLELARAVPGTTIVLDHLCTPLGVGPWAGRQDEVFEVWAPAMAEVARCENVVAKLGGMAMPDNGFWLDGNRPTVDEFLAQQERWYLHMLDCFGPERCLFESNFPVDKRTVDYAVVWDAFGRIAGRCSPTEQDELFAGTARRVYRL